MPGISKKGLQMPESPIRKLVPFAKAAKRKGTKVYHLNIGQPDIQTPEVALEAIRNFNHKVIEYSHSAGIENYRRKLADYYAIYGIGIEYTDLMITTGGSEAITFALNSICDLGDEVIVPEPFYANYNGFAISAGVKVIPVTSTIDTGFALPDIEQFESWITPRTRAIIICNPGNPTGYLYSRQELLKLRDLCLKHDLFLIADEVYREFAYDGTRHHSILNLEGLEEHAIVIDSVSKRYSMCGVRIGTLISRNKKLMATALKFAQARLSPPTLGQIAAEAALDTPQSYFDAVISEYTHRRNILVDGLNSIPGVYCPKPKGAFYCVAKLPVHNAEDFARWLLAEFSYQEHTVMVAPANGFYATPHKGENEVRLAYVLKADDLQHSVEILRHALTHYPNKA